MCELKICCVFDFGKVVFGVNVFEIEFWLVFVEVE